MRSFVLSGTKKKKKKKKEERERERETEVVSAIKVQKSTIEENRMMLKSFVEICTVWCVEP